MSLHVETGPNFREARGLPKVTGKPLVCRSCYFLGDLSGGARAMFLLAFMISTPATSPFLCTLIVCLRQLPCCRRLGLPSLQCIECLPRGRSSPSRLSPPQIEIHLPSLIVLPLRTAKSELQATLFGFVNYNPLAGARVIEPNLRGLNGCVWGDSFEDQVRSP